MGFQQDLENILTQCRPDRQTLMFSATWPREVQQISDAYTYDRIRVQIGSSEISANSNVSLQSVLTYFHFGKQMKKQVGKKSAVRKRYEGSFRRKTLRLYGKISF